MIYALALSLGFALSTEPMPQNAQTATAAAELSAEELLAIELAAQSDAPKADPLRDALATVVKEIDLAFIFDGALAVFSEPSPAKTGAHDPSRTGFNLQQLELSLGANADPFFRLDGNLVFSEFGVEIEEIYATTTRLPLSIQARAGQFLTRFGRINPLHPHAWKFVDQPLVIGKFFGADANRGLGAEVSWIVPASWFVEVVGSANQATGECCARSFFGASDVPVRGIDDLLYTLTLEQFFPFNDDWSLSLGFSGQFGPNASGNDNRSEIYGTDIYLRYRPVDSPDRTALSLEAEGLFRSRQIPAESPLQDYGLYVQALYNIDPEWEVGARYEWVSGLDSDPLDPEWTEHRQRVTAQTTFYPSHFSRLRLEGAVDDPDWADQPGWSGTLALELIIGAHGAHSF